MKTHGMINEKNGNEARRRQEKRGGNLSRKAKTQNVISLNEIIREERIQL